jgi:hypothetical protein
VLGDTIFIGLSIFWFSQLIHIVRQPKIYLLFTQAAAVFILFVLRYNAMIYPIIAAGAFLLSSQKAKYKLLGILSGPILIIPFIIFSANAAKRMTGTAQFPPILGGWQWANNALYMRHHVAVDSTAFPTSETSELDAIARQFYREMPHVNYPAYDICYFIGIPVSPLHRYLDEHYTSKNTYDYIASWGKAAVVFDQYGKYLIRHYPGAYFRYYLLMNTKKYFLPPLEVLSSYNKNRSTINEPARIWFGLSTDRVRSVSDTIQAPILSPFSYFYLILNAVYAVLLLLFSLKGVYKKTGRFFNTSLLVVTLFWGLNFLFSVFSTCIVLRYQIFPMIILLSYTLLLASNSDFISAASSLRRSKID